MTLLSSRVSIFVFKRAFPELVYFVGTIIVALYRLLALRGHSERKRGGFRFSRFWLRRSERDFPGGVRTRDASAVLGYSKHAPYGRFRDGREFVMHVPHLWYLLIVS